MNDEVKIRVHITKGSLVLAELHSSVQPGRNEFCFGEPIRANGRSFAGFAIECWLDQEPQHIAFTEYSIGQLKR